MNQEQDKKSGENKKKYQNKLKVEGDEMIG
jgi:hypothetical protein